MGFFWLTCTCLAEVPGYILRYWVGIWFSSYLLATYHLLAFSRHHPMTPQQVGWGFVVLGVILHTYIAVRQLSTPQHERIKMRPPDAEQTRTKSGRASL